MYIINHFLDVVIAPEVQVPDRINAGKTNSKKSIGAQTDICKGLYQGAAPSFVLLNFIDQGDWSQKEGAEVPADGGPLDFCGFLGGFGIDC
jgi:hypothetical protein